MNKKQPIAYLICGFIGAGKTTFAKKLEKKTGAIRITKDEWLVKIFGMKITTDKNFQKYDQKTTSLATEIAFRILKAGHDVIIDEGYWNKSHRDEIKMKVTMAGAKPILYYVESTLEEMRKRTISRSKMPSEDSFVISGAMFDSYAKDWHPPTQNEEFILCK